MNIIMEQNGLATVQLDSTVMMGEEGMMGEVGMEPVQAKNSVMSSWVFVIGISAATLAVSIVLGILLAKKRIKKGFDQYED